MSGAKPVTVGQGYSTIAIIPETEGSWALPLLHERITSFSNPIAAAQLRLVSQNLPTRPLSMWDAEYGCASFVKQTADIMLINSCAYAIVYSTVRRHLTQALVVPVFMGISLNSTTQQHGGHPTTC